MPLNYSFSSKAEKNGQPQIKHNVYSSQTCLEGQNYLKQDATPAAWYSWFFNTYITIISQYINKEKSIKRQTSYV